jgi:cytochrome c oxidase cbb3-type subunit 3/ubiquinol-cytochrome c reductase cytochrome c subunit
MNSPHRPNPRLLLLWLLAGAATLAIAGCMAAPGKPGPGPEVPRPEDVSSFATLYGQNCAACHGENGKNGAAIWLANPAYLAIAGVTNIQRVTADGVPGTAMPPFGKAKGGMLTDQQISVLVQGMEQNWTTSVVVQLVGGTGTPTPHYAATTLGDPTRGQKAFGTYCAQCHGANATGAHLDNNITTGSLVDPSYLALISDQGLRSIILAGQTEQGPHDWRSYTPGHPMTDQEIADTVAWLTSHRIATPGQPYQQRH